MAQQMTGAEMVIEALSDQGVTTSSGIQAARCCRSMMRCFSRTSCGTCWCGMSRAPRTWPRAMRARPARSA